MGTKFRILQQLKIMFWHIPRRIACKHTAQRKSCAIGDHNLRMGRTQCFLWREAQTLCKNIHQCWVKGQRTTLKNNRFLDIQTLSQTADGLLGNSVERRQCQILAGNTLIQQGLDICLGINTTAAGNIINAAALRGQFIEFFYRYL